MSWTVIMWYESNYISRSPSVNVNRYANKENIVPSNVLKDATPVKQRANCNGRVSALDNTKMVSSVDKNFNEKFYGWLQETEQQIDSATFAQLKRDLNELVGKYTLAKRN